MCPYLKAFLHLMISQLKGQTYMSRHINIRYYHAKELVENGDIIFEHCATENM